MACKVHSDDGRRRTSVKSAWCAEKGEAAFRVTAGGVPQRSDGVPNLGPATISRSCTHLTTPSWRALRTCPGLYGVFIWLNIAQSFAVSRPANPRLGVIPNHTGYGKL